MVSTQFISRFPTLVDVAKDAKRLPGDCMQTVIFKQAGPTLLHADIYLPEPSHLDGSKRPVGKQNRTLNSHILVLNG